MPIIKLRTELISAEVERIKALRETLSKPMMAKIYQENWLGEKGSVQRAIRYRRARVSKNRYMGEVGSEKRKAFNESIRVKRKMKWFNEMKEGTK